MSNVIKLVDLEWGNMFSYGPKNFLDFTKNIVTQVVAINGSGKSAIVLILQEVLFSKNMKGIKKGDIVNRYSGSDAYYAILNMLINADRYTISVKRKGATSKVAISCNGQDISDHKIPETYKKLLSLYGASYEVLTQLMYQSSKSQLEFLTATDTNRKKFLVSLFSLERYLQDGEILKAEVTKVDRILAQLEGEQKAVQDFLNQPGLVLDKKEKIEVPTISDSLREEIRVLEADIANYQESCKKIDKNNLLLQEQKSITFDMGMQDVSEIELTTARELYHTLLAQISNFERDIQAEKKSLLGLNTATHCPTCKQPIDNSHSIAMANSSKNKIAELELTLGETKSGLTLRKNELLKLDNQRSSFLANQKKIERFTQLSQLIDSNIPLIYPDNNATKTALLDKKSQLEIQVRAQNDAIKFNTGVEVSNAKVETLINQKREFLARQELISSDIINTQNKSDRLTTLRKAFSPTGIVAYKLENIIKEFENEINEYLVELSDGQFQINFRLEGEKLNIIVFSNGVESPIESASEGEFSRIQSATLLAIRKLLSQRGGVEINFLFLDEVMGVLDLAGKERLIEILQKEESTNTFIVAHDFSHPLVPKLEIVKENNTARIV